MRVEEIMSTELETCRAEDSLRAASQSMWDHDIGLLPVVTADGRVTSVITDRDIAMAACIAGKPLSEIKVSDAMSRRLVTVLPSDDLQRTGERMQAEQVHRIPVVDGAGFLRGIITINDLARHLRNRKQANGVTPEAVAGTVAAISAPRAAVLVGLIVTAGLTLGAAAPNREAPAGEGGAVKQVFSEKLPNVPGKTLTVVEVDYRPGGFSAAHRHPASGFVFAYVVSGEIRSQVEGEPLRVYRAGQSWTEPPNAHHLVSANASKTRPARLIAWIIADDGAQPTVYDK
ncbi:MAG TPA: CBS domain-containing protein [Myxococcaceae bacterium]|nr:CBS domain-containing protein [Myxococcaceae bacterium]